MTKKAEDKRPTAPKEFRQTVAQGIWACWHSPKESTRQRLIGMLSSAYLCGFWPWMVCHTVEVCLDKPLGFFDIKETEEWLDRLIRAGDPEGFLKRTTRRKKAKDGEFQLNHKCFGFRKVLESFAGDTCETVPWRRVSWDLGRRSISVEDSLLEFTVEDILAKDWTPEF